MNSAEFELWRRRQESERDRIQRLGRDPTPPELPPKKPHLRTNSASSIKHPPASASHVNPTYLLETDFHFYDGDHSSRAFKRPPAPIPSKSSDDSTEWGIPSFPRYPEAQRTYHKDSYMAHRQCLGQEGRYRRTSSPATGRRLEQKTPAFDVAREEFHRSLLQSSPDDNEEHSSAIDLELSNLSLSSEWEKNALSSCSSSVIFTSNALKKIRRQKTGNRKLTPPEVAPKPYRRPVQSDDNAGSIHASKSTPSLNVVPDNRQTSASNNNNNEKWKLSADALDTSSSMSTSPPQQSSLARGDEEPPKPANKHFHSNSDSGLSSLGGRASTMSPVSTMSSVSSVSSGSSRAPSLRSASIVSSATFPGDEIRLEEEEEEEEETASTTVVTNSSPDEESSISLERPPFRTNHLRKRPKFQEEIDCDEMSRDLMRALNSYPLRQHHSFKNLRALFVTSPAQKTLVDYVQGVLELEHLETKSSKSNRPPSPTVLKRKIEEFKNSEGSPSQSTNFDSGYGSSNGHPSLSESFTKMSMQKETFSNANELELQRKKDELLKRISQKLDVLRAEQLSLKEEIGYNEELGRMIGNKVRRSAKSNEFDKYELHVQEIDKITSLLFGLSGRLARAENGLSAFLPNDQSDDKQSLMDKRNKLSQQLDEAKLLKENIDRRALVVSDILRKYLSSEQYDDYDHFVKMKAKLIMDSREISEKIKLGEEQLHALKNSLHLKQMA